MKKSSVIFISIFIIMILVDIYNVYRFLSEPVRSNKSETIIFIDEGDIIDGDAMFIGNRI